MCNILNKTKSYCFFVIIVMGMLLGISNATAAKGISKENNDIIGKVIDQYGNPVPDVVITMKNSNFRVVTDVNGTFEFRYDKGKVLCFSHPGFLYKEVKVNKLRKNERDFKLTISEEYIKSRKIVNRPYGVEDKDSYLGSEAAVYSDQLSTMMSSTFIPSLRGRMPGLNVIQTRGARTHYSSSISSGTLIGNVPNESLVGQSAYGDNTEFNISSRHNSPVVVVDGIQRELFSIDPESIESVSLQKDALSSMFLGMRSSRGALIVTTKEPIAGDFQLSFTGRFGVQTPVDMPEPLSSSQYAYLLNEALQNDGRNTMYTYDDFKKFRTQSNPYTHPNVNWYDELLKKNSTIQSYNLNASGGNKFAQYFVSLGYMSEGGLFKSIDRVDDVHDTNLSYERYSINSKVNINITDDFKAKITLFGRVEEGTQPGGNGGGYTDILSSIYTTPNGAYPIYNPNGTWGGSIAFTNNLMSQTVASGYLTDGARDVMGIINLYYDLDKVVKGLSTRLIGGVAFQNRTAVNRTMRSEVYEYTENSMGEGLYSEYGSPAAQSNSFSSVSSYQQMYGQFAIDYERQFGLHSVKASLMGDTRTTITNWNLPEYPTNIIVDASYDYAKKYFVQAAMSESYYNRYAPGKRWGTFYALGLGWDISKEDFMEDADWLDQLKLRAVYGKTGSGIDNSGYYSYLQLYSENGDSYSLGTSYTNGGAYSENTPLANPNITWEKAHKINLGIDMTLFNNRLKITADYYNDKYYDLLQTRGKSIELIGQSYPNENVGKARWFGGELSVTYQNHINDFNYYISGNWSCEQSKLLFKDEQEQPYDYLYATGKPVGAVWGLLAEGFFTSQEEIDKSPLISGYDNIQPGDIKYKDVNGDKVIDANDRVVIGGDKPLSYFGIDLGFNWRGLEFSMLWQGVYNRDIYLSDATLIEGFQSIGQTYGQAYKHMLGRWTPETAETATFPRLSAGGNNYNKGNGWNSSFWMRSGNFLRLKYMSIGYTLPDIFCQNYLGGTRVKIFISGQNLLTFSGCNLQDPEVSFTNYPLQRCISTGINVKF